jgi:hypothetical protein
MTIATTFGEPSDQKLDILASNLVETVLDHQFLDLNKSVLTTFFFLHPALRRAHPHHDPKIYKPAAD